MYEQTSSVAARLQIYEKYERKKSYKKIYEPDKAFTPLKQVLKNVVVLVGTRLGQFDSTSSTLHLVLPRCCSSSKRGKVTDESSGEECLAAIYIYRKRDRGDPERHREIGLAWCFNGCWRKEEPRILRLLEMGGTCIYIEYKMWCGASCWAFKFPLPTPFETS